MYGFLQVDRCKLNPSDRAAYAQMYCGQCAALQGLFGYTRRAMVSYDAAFLGLLISAQQKEEVNHSKSWCGVFPKRMTIHDPAGLPQIFSASMAAIICSMKLTDSQQDGKSFIKSMANRICSSTFKKAEVVLRSLNFPADIVTNALERQKKIEASDKLSIKQYAEPTAFFLAEVFRFTATKTGKHSNEDALYQIGYHVGQLIYLIDSCIDIIDDLDRNNFNALMAAYRDNETPLSGYSRDEVTSLAVNSLTRIKVLTQTLTLERHQDIIANVLFLGLPKTIHRRVTKSINRLKKTNIVLLKSLPHAVMASAVCLIHTQNAEAGWVTGTEPDGRFKGIVRCGYQCFDPHNDCTFGFDFCLNPFYCLVTEKGDECCIFIISGICQIPKEYGLYSAIKKMMQANKKRLDENQRMKQEQEARKEANSQAEERKRDEERVAQLAKKKQEIIVKNRQFTDRFLREMLDFEQYCKGVGISLKCSRKLENLLSIAANTHMEILTDKHNSIKAIEALLEEARNDRKLVESANMKFREALSIFKKSDEIARKYGIMPLIKELEVIHAQLSDNFKELISNKEWDKFDSFIIKAADELKNIHDLALNKSSRIVDASDRSMVIYENVSSRKMLTLLAACTSNPQILGEIVVEDFESTSAAWLWQHLDEHEFISESAKSIEVNLKQHSINSLRQMKVSELFSVYGNLKNLKLIIDKSENSLANSHFQYIDVYHRDWRSYLMKVLDSNKKLKEKFLLIENSAVQYRRENGDVQYRRCCNSPTFKS